MNRRLLAIDEKFRNFQYREIVKELLYDTSADLAWYLKRAKEPRLKEFFGLWCRAIAPFAPHTAEEIWHRMGGKTFVVNESMPRADEKLVSENHEMREDLLAKVIGDVENISRLASITPKRVSIFTAEEWKREAYAIAREERNFEKAVKRCMAKPEMKQRGAELMRFLKQIGKNIFSLPQAMDGDEEGGALAEGRAFLAAQLGAEVEILPAEKSAHPKARNAMPGKPAIVLE